MSRLADLWVSWGPAGLFLLALLDGAGIPLPAGVDALLLFLAATGPGNAFIAALLAVVGSVAGSLILFWIARRGGQAYLDRYTATGRAARFREWFLHYGLITVFIPALVPIPMPLKVFVLSAGALGVRPLTFVLVIIAARVPRYLALAYLGVRVGENSVAWLQTHAVELVGVAVVLCVALFLLVKLTEKRRGALHC